MKVNGHEILVSTNAVKLSQILSGSFKGIRFTLGFLGIATAYCHNGFPFDLDDHKNKMESPPIFFARV